MALVDADYVIDHPASRKAVGLPEHMPGALRAMPEAHEGGVTPPVVRHPFSPNG